MTTCACYIFYFKFNKSFISFFNNFVAGKAINICVRACKGKASFFVIEFNGLPIVERMAAQAIGFSVFFELPEVNVRMALNAIGSKRFKNLDFGFFLFFNVTFHALNFFVLAFEREIGKQVIEFNFSPAFGRMATGAIFLADELFAHYRLVNVGMAFNALEGFEFELPIL